MLGKTKEYPEVSCPRGTIMNGEYIDDVIMAKEIVS